MDFHHSECALATLPGTARDLLGKSGRCNMMKIGKICCFLLKKGLYY